MSDKSNKKTVDGRRLRSARCKQSIIEACEHLMSEGNLVPTAQMISDRAEVPIRTFFRHYPDMETLFSAVDEAMRPEYGRIFTETKSEGGLSDRIASVVELHAKSWDQNKPVLKSTKAQLWRYRVLRDNYAKVNLFLRKDLNKRIPELNGVAKDTRELIDGLMSFEMWERLRDHQNLSREKSIHIIRRSVELLLQTGIETG
ncbi:MAG: TetR/AcrR family transcriptional regulator [Gammaproteobacteria bacterium]|nr:TetR/AcrR family transcriptional regulator [Gammaproteobacteria bacterium]